MFLKRLFITLLMSTILILAPALGAHATNDPPAPPPSGDQSSQPSEETNTLPDKPEGNGDDSNAIQPPDSDEGYISHLYQQLKVDLRFMNNQALELEKKVAELESTNMWLSIGGIIVIFGLIFVNGYSLYRYMPRREPFFISNLLYRYMPRRKRK